MKVKNLNLLMNVNATEIKLKIPAQSQAKYPLIECQMLNTIRLVESGWQLQKMSPINSNEAMLS
jgi:hypothetical protein